MSSKGYRGIVIQNHYKLQDMWELIEKKMKKIHDGDRVETAGVFPQSYSDAKP